MNAVIRNGALRLPRGRIQQYKWNLRGDSSGAAVTDRDAVFKLQISPDGTTLALADHGRVFDPAATNAWWYYFPSLIVNCAGDMVAGFSGSSPTNYIDRSMLAGRQRSDPGSPGCQMVVTFPGNHWATIGT